jgi:Domain of unknown function (DUF1877)
MSVDFFWRRIEPSLIRNASPGALFKLIPHHLEEQFRTDLKAGVIVVVEFNGDLIYELLTSGAADSDDAATSELVLPHTEVMMDHMIDVLNPDQVRAVARFLADAPVDAWMQQHQGYLAQRAREMRFHQPFDAAWAQTVLDDIAELTTLFRAAAAEGEAIIVKVDA